MNDYLPMAFEIAVEVARLVVDAFNNNDAAALRKVTDVLPEGSTLKSRAAFELAKRRAEIQLGNS